MKGWNGSIVGIRDFKKLPKEAKAYLKNSAKVHKNKRC